MLTCLDYASFSLSNRSKERKTKIPEVPKQAERKHCLLLAQIIDPKHMLRSKHGAADTEPPGSSGTSPEGRMYPADHFHVPPLPHEAFTHQGRTASLPTPTSPCIRLDLAVSCKEKLVQRS